MLAAMPFSISVENVGRRFGPVQALDAVTFDVPSGEVVGLLGHNGAGKTTTIRILNGLLSPDSGRIQVLGLDPTHDGPRIRARTGVLTETPSLDERLTARENLALFAELFAVDRARVRQRVLDLLVQFELAERADDRVSGFSRGMKQRLALARSLLHDPELVFLDEPTAALDPVAARGVHDLIRRLGEDPGRTVVISTHNLVEAQRLCDRVIILRRGRLVAAGTPQELAQTLARQSRVDLEVGPDDAGTATAAIAELAPGVAIEVDGDRISVGGIDRERLPELLRRLVEAGVSVYRLSPSEPTLEDAYFALHAPEGAA